MAGLDFSALVSKKRELVDARTEVIRDLKTVAASYIAEGRGDDPKPQTMASVMVRLISGVVALNSIEDELESIQNGTGWPSA